MPEAIQRHVLLNWLISVSKTRARTHEPPVHSANELLEILRARMAKSWAIEFVDAEDSNSDLLEAQRVSNNNGKSFIRLYDYKIKDSAEFRYVSMLIKFVDANVKGFSVEDTKSFTGREIEGTDTERGVTSIHFMARLPLTESQFDLGKYRCAIEYSPPLTRIRVENFLCRQLRRQSDAEEWKFPVSFQKTRRSQLINKEPRYTPRLELHSDVGRKLGTGTTAESDISQMVFTKRSERQNIQKGADIEQIDLLANVQLRISGAQIPKDQEEKKSWIDGVLEHFTGLGFESRIYYRHAAGGIVGGGIHHTVDAAADLLMCPKELISLQDMVKPSEPKLNDAMIAAMQEILDKDEVWIRVK